VGGITVQTFFLAIADLSFRRTNLEHAAASAANLMQAVLLIALLCLPLIIMHMPALTVWGVHPVSPMMLVGYVFGVRLVAGTKRHPMWRPRQTPQTVEDKPAAQAQQANLLKLFVTFSVCALILCVSGYLVARSGSAISSRTGLSETAVGAYFTAISTSLPELVTSVAAVRAGALTLAVGGILGGNAFDTLFLAVSDVAYRQGSIYHAVDIQQRLLMLVAILMTAIIVMGLLGRQKKGIANIGMESFLIILIYVGTSLYIFW
jgi:cation:H+ antiporter